MNTTKLSRQEKEALFKQEARKLLDFEDWDQIDDEFDDSWNPKNWTDKKLDERLRDAIGQVKFNKIWPVVSFVIVLIIIVIVFKFIF